MSNEEVKELVKSEQVLDSNMGDEKDVLSPQPSAFSIGKKRAVIAESRTQQRNVNKAGRNRKKLEANSQEEASLLEQQLLSVIDQTHDIGELKKALGVVIKALVKNSFTAKSSVERIAARVEKGPSQVVNAVKELRSENAQIHQKMRALTRKHGRMLLKEKSESKKKTGTWIENWEEYVKKIDSLDWSTLSTEEFVISKIGGRWWVRAKSYDAYATAVQAVVTLGKSKNVPHPRLRVTPDSIDQVFSRSRKTGTEKMVRGKAPKEASKQ
jgi:hypothetical protein